MDNQSSFSNKSFWKTERKTEGKIGPLWKCAPKVFIYNIKTIFTILGQNTAKFYDKHILLTVLCIFWPNAK